MSFTIKAILLEIQSFTPDHKIVRLMQENPLKAGNYLERNISTERISKDLGT